MAVDRKEDAIRQIRRAQALAPFTSVLIDCLAARVFYFAGLYGQALDLLTTLANESPPFYFTFWNLGLVSLKLNRPDEAITSLKTAADLAPDNPSVLSTLGCAYVAGGLTTEAYRIAEELMRRTSTKHVPGIDIASLWAWLGDFDQAFAWLETAIEERSGMLCWLGTWPLYQPLRDHPRCAPILIRMGLRR